MYLRHLVCAACFAPALLAQAATTDQLAAPRAVRIVPLSGFHLDGPALRPVPLPSFVDGGSEAAVMQFMELLPQRAEADAITDLVVQRFEAEVDDGRLFVDARHRSLRLWGEAPLVDAAAQWLAALERALVEQVVVEVWLLPIGDASASGDASPVFGPDQVPARRDALWHGQTTMAAGQATELGDWRRTPIVRSLNLEVAQESSVANPEVRSLGEGVRVAVEVHALAEGGDLVVFGQAAFAERRGPIRAEPTGLLGQPSFDAFELDSDAATFSARVRDGGGVVVWHGGAAADGAQRALVVRLQRVVSDRRPTDDFEVIPTGALTRAGLPARVVGAGDEVATEGIVAVESDSPAYSSVLEIDEVIDLAGTLLGDAWEEGTATVRPLGEALVVRAPAEQRRQVRELIARLEDDLIVNSGVLLETRNDERTLHQIAFPALLGRPHFAVRGVESTGVGGMWSEIAQKSAVLVPQVDLRFRGLIASVVPSASVLGIHVDAQIDLAVTDPAVRRTLEGERGGVLSLATARHARFLREGAVQRRTVIDLGDGPEVDGSRTRQRLEIR